MSISVLNHPAQLTPQWHAEFLKILRISLVSWANHQRENALAEGYSIAFRIRDWWLAQEDNTHIIQVYIDSTDDQIVSADDCLRIHRWLMDTQVFDAFGDDFSIEVSSSGIETPLRDLEDFKSSLGKQIYLDTWEKIGERQRYSMLLKEVTDGNAPQVRLQEGEQTFDIPLDKVRWAYVRYLHPEKSKPKKSKKSEKR